MAITPWNKESISALFELPFFELIYKARTVHQLYFPKDEMELCTLLNIKSGACPEDCSYCPQSAHYKTNLDKYKLMPLEEVKTAASRAKERGAKRFCMGAAWRSPPKKGFEQVLEMVRTVKSMGLETCVTLGMLDDEHVEQLKCAGLDFYNHNLDTSPEYYDKIITTRVYADRLTTIDKVHKAGIGVCTGGILGLGESREDRVSLLNQLIHLSSVPESITINRLIAIPGTPLEHAEPIDNFEFIRTIAVARILIPRSMIRLSAGRDQMSDEMQAFCFMAGANSIFYGEEILLSAPNPSAQQDLHLLERLGISAEVV